MHSLPGISFDCSDETYRSLLVQAVKECDVQTYHVLIANGADPLKRFELPEPDPRDQYHWYDSYDGYFGDYEASCDQPTEEDTLLFLAARVGCAHIVEHLLALGEDPEHRGASRQNALEAWVQSSQVDMENCHWDRVGELLLEAGCNPKSNNGYVWKAAAGKKDGRAKHILLGWQARLDREALAERTVQVGAAANDALGHGVGTDEVDQGRGRRGRL